MTTAELPCLYLITTEIQLETGIYFLFELDPDFHEEYYSKLQ